MRSGNPKIDVVAQARALRALVLSAFFVFALAPSASGQGAEAVTWARANNCASIRAYLSQYPSGRYVSEARAALRAKSCPDPEAEARRRAEREATERARLENETRDLRDRLAREEAARRAAETRAADEARKRVAAETTANAAKQKASSPPASYNLSLLHPDVRRAVERARAAESRAVAAAARARQFAQQSSGVTATSSFTGLGTYTNSQAPYAGDRLAGEFVSGKLHGSAVYTWAAGNSSRYEGEFSSGNRQGAGIYYWRDGQRYAGLFSNNNRHSVGVNYNAGGDRFEGELQNDKASGYGVRWTTDGQVMQAGIWSNDQLTTPLRP